MSSPIEFPDKLQCLFEPHRYKVLYGGRGGAKSWGIARALLIRASNAKRRVLCTREIQKSIKDSVHKLLSDQIEALGLGEFYEVQQTVIKGANGSEFIFSGLSDQTNESIKSFEGVDDVWVEEAQAVSKRSWDILIPTIRKDGSEIWISLNPELDTDETYVRFISNPPPDSVVVRINYADNPWFPKVLEAERLHAKDTMKPAEYANIWEGKTLPAVAGAIYADEMADAAEKGRICNVPYDPRFKVHVIFDLGWNDQMSLILVQRHLSELRVIEYLEDNRKTLDVWSAELKEKKLNWGQIWLPHDGAHGDYKTGKSAQQIMEGLGWECGPNNVIPRTNVEVGIRLARPALKRTYFDKTLANGLVQCLRRYKRALPVATGEPGLPVHDQWSHGADAYRYLAHVADQLTNDTHSGSLAYPDLGIV